MGERRGRERGERRKQKGKELKTQNSKLKKKEASDTPPLFRKEKASLLGRHSSAPVSNGSRPPVDTIVFSGLVLFFVFF